MENTSSRQRVLIVDDAELNREMLKSMLIEQFDVVTAENGAQALKIISDKDNEVSIVLLDILMPEMDGFAVLEHMKKHGYLDYLPVIIISAESTADSVDKAYELGATEFITKPFNPAVVRHRVTNNIRLFNRQQALMQVVTDKVYERNRYAAMMINILSTVMEVKNGESGLHILHINAITRILAENLLTMTDKYSYTSEDIQLISNASSLHDIGKMAIPDEIINKPGKLTAEEFEIMKTHSEKGAKLIESLVEYKDEALVKYAYEICLYHHERYDGRGYPCGLKGEEIPIWAQIVSVADVFDALISERVYKAAYTPEKALEMICNGECGEFNPLLIQCLLKSKEKIVSALRRASSAEKWEEKVRSVQGDLENISSEGFAGKVLKKFSVEMAKHKYFVTLSDGILFEYNIMDDEIVMFANPKLGIEEDVVFDPTDREQVSKHFFMPVFDKAQELLRTATYENPETVFEFERDMGDSVKVYSVHMLSIFSADKKSCLSVVGKIKKVFKKKGNVK